MDRFGLIGTPLSHSLSPSLFKAAYGGIFGYDLIERPTFDEALEAFAMGPYRAVNVTAPFKEQAFRIADDASPECRHIGAANILLKTERGIKAFNSDFLAVKSILSRLDGVRDVAVVGFGGAGKAALYAAQDSGFPTTLFRHGTIADGISADAVIYTLPGSVSGTFKIRCRHLLEANYRNPVLCAHPGYISGKVWLLSQAALGYPIMTGLEVSLKAMSSIIE